MRDADDDFRFGERGAFVDLADEVLDHLFGDVEIGDHAVAHRADRLDRTGRPAQHQLSVFTKSQRLLHTVFDLIGHHGGLVQDHAFAFHIDKRVCRAEVDCHIGGEKAAKSEGHILGKSCCHVQKRRGKTHPRQTGLHIGTLSRVRKGRYQRKSALFRCSGWGQIAHSEDLWRRFAVGVGPARGLSHIKRRLYKTLPAGHGPRPSHGGGSGG